MRSQSIETGTIRGKVQINSDGPLQGVNVRFESMSVSDIREVKSDREGVFNLPSLSIGQGVLTFSLIGFHTIVQPVTVSLGKTHHFLIELTPESIFQEDLVVTHRQPVIDPVQIHKGRNFTYEDIQMLPVNRDPWGLMGMVAGVSLNSYQVGASHAGNQPSFAAPGLTSSDNGYYVDGVYNTDVVATGSSPQYYDMNRFSEVQISTGAHDPSIQAAGVVINMISFTGNNEWTGFLNIYYQDEHVQSTNPIDVKGESRQLGRAIDYHKDGGIRISGPLVKDRLFLSTGIHQENIQGYSDFTLTERDFIRLQQWDLKLTYKPSENHSFTISYQEDEKFFPFRNMNGAISRFSSMRQSGIGPKLMLSYQGIFGNDWVVQVKAGIHNNPLKLLPQKGVRMDIPAIYDARIPWGGDESGNYRMNQGSGWYQDNKRDRDQFGIKGQYFNSNILGATHDFMIGGDLSFAYSRNDNLIQGDARVHFDADASFIKAGLVYLYQSAELKQDLETHSIYLNDKISWNRWKMSLGLRWDYQSGNLPEGSAGIPQWFDPDWSYADSFLPVTFGDIENIVSWSNLEPRISVAYNIDEKGAHILKTGYFRYTRVLDTQTFADSAPNSITQMVFYWRDRNNDGQWDLSETRDETVVASANIKPNGTDIDPALKAPVISEFPLIYEGQHGLWNWKCSITYKETEKQIYRQDRRLELDDWIQIEPQTFTDSRGQEHHFPALWVFVGSYREEYYITNYSGRSDEYWGQTIEVQKRMGDSHWAFYLTAVHNDFSIQYDLNSVENPNFVTNELNSIRAGQYASEWSGKLNVSIRLPWDLTISSFMRFDSGDPYPITFSLKTGLYHTNAWVGNGTMPQVFIADFGISKTIDVTKGHINVHLNAFNLFNTNTITEYMSTDVYYPYYLDPLDTVSPRVFRVGVNYRF